MTDTYDDEIRQSMNVGPPDMTHMYNTQLTPSQEAAFQQTLYARDVYDYDARGEFLAQQSRDPTTGHGQDTFKKPNHPTFSTGSMYHGVDGYGDGTWLDNMDGTWSFIPSQTNVHHACGERPRQQVTTTQQQESMTHVAT